MSKIMVRYEPVDVAPRRMPHNRATGPNTLARRNIVAAQQPRRQRVNLWSAKLLWMELESDATVQRAFRELVDGAFEGGFRFLLVPAQEAALPLGELMERGVEPPYLNKPGFKRVARAFDERALFSMYLLGAAPSPSNTPPPQASPSSVSPRNSPTGSSSMAATSSCPRHSSRSTQRAGTCGGTPTRGSCSMNRTSKMASMPTPPSSSSWTRAARSASPGV